MIRIRGEISDTQEGQIKKKHGASKGSLGNAVSKKNVEYWNQVFENCLNMNEPAWEAPNTERCSMSLVSWPLTLRTCSIWRAWPSTKICRQKKKEVVSKCPNVSAVFPSKFKTAWNTEWKKRGILWRLIRLEGKNAATCARGETSTTLKAHAVYWNIFRGRQPKTNWGVVSTRYRRQSVINFLLCKTPARGMSRKSLLHQT